MYIYIYVYIIKVYFGFFTPFMMEKNRSMLTTMGRRALFSVFSFLIKSPSGMILNKSLSKSEVCIGLQFENSKICSEK